MKIPFLKRKQGSVKKKHSRFFSFGKNPYSDWRMLLIMWMVLFVLIIAFSSYLFWRVLRGDLFLVVDREETALKTFDQDAIKKILSDFDAKDKILQELESKRIDIVSPSL